MELEARDAALGFPDSIALPEAIFVKAMLRVGQPRNTNILRDGWGLPTPYEGVRGTFRYFPTCTPLSKGAAEVVGLLTPQGLRSEYRGGSTLEALSQQRAWCQGQSSTQRPITVLTKSGPTAEGTLEACAAREELTAEEWLIRDDRLDLFPFGRSLAGTYQGYSWVAAEFAPFGNPSPDHLLEYTGIVTLKVQGATYTGQFMMDFMTRRCSVEWRNYSGGETVSWAEHGAAEHAVAQRHKSVLAAFNGRFEYSSESPKICFVAEGNDGHPPEGMRGPLVTPQRGTAPTVELSNPSYHDGAEARAKGRGYQGTLFLPSHVRDRSLHFQGRPVATANIPRGLLDPRALGYGNEPPPKELLVSTYGLLPARGAGPIGQSNPFGPWMLYGRVPITSQSQM